MLHSKDVNVTQQNYTIGYYLDEIAAGRLLLPDKGREISDVRCGTLIRAVLLGIPMPQIVVDARKDPWCICFEGEWLWAFHRLVTDQVTFSTTIQEFEDITNLTFSQWSKKWQRKVRNASVASIHMNEGMPSEVSNYCYLLMRCIHGKGF
jgi:hypothetical protein